MEWKDTGVRLADLKVQKKGRLRRMVTNAGKVITRYTAED